MFDVSLDDDDPATALIDRVWPALRYTHITGQCKVVYAIGADGEPLVASTTERICPGTIESLTADPGQLDAGVDPVYLHDPAGAPADAFGVKLYGSAEAFAADAAAIAASTEFRAGTVPGRYAVSAQVPGRGECMLQLYPSAAAVMLWCDEAAALVSAIDGVLAQT